MPFFVAGLRVPEDFAAQHLGHWLRLDVPRAEIVCEDCSETGRLERPEERPLLRLVR